MTTPVGSGADTDGGAPHAGHLPRRRRPHADRAVRRLPRPRLRGGIGHARGAGGAGTRRPRPGGSRSDDVRPRPAGGLRTEPRPPGLDPGRRAGGAHGVDREHGLRERPQDRDARRGRDPPRTGGGDPGGRHGEHVEHAVHASPGALGLSTRKRRRRGRDVPRRLLLPPGGAGHGRHGREPRGPLRDLPRGAGRLRGPQPAALRGRTQDGRLRRREGAHRDRGSEARPHRLQRGRARARRSHPGEAREAPRGLPGERYGPRRQLQRHHRRRRGDRGAVAGTPWSGTA